MRVPEQNNPMALANTAPGANLDDGIERRYTLNPHRVRYMPRLRFSVLARSAQWADTATTAEGDSMDVGRLCQVLGSDTHAHHQRIAEYVRAKCAAYSGMGFTPREEWIVEQTLASLGIFLHDVRCSNDERRAIEEFLALAAVEIPGSP